MDMAFNSQTYHANKHRKEAWVNLSRAREIKNRMMQGVAYDWELPRITFFVKLARSDMKLHLLMRKK